MALGRGGVDAGSCTAGAATASAAAAAAAAVAAAGRPPWRCPVHLPLVKALPLQGE